MANFRHSNFNWSMSCSIQTLFLDKREKQIAQDEKTWSEVGLDIDKITHFLNDLVDDHSYVSSEDSKFHYSYSVFLQPKNPLQLKRTQKF